MSRKRIEFLEALPKAEAERIWHGELALDPVRLEEVPIDEALGRILGEDISATLNVPPFDRAIVDGFAVIAADTFDAGETAPVTLELLPEKIPAGAAPTVEVRPGTAVEIATGGVLPRGANAVQMVERSEVDGDRVRLYRAVVPGAGIQAAGSDLRAGDLVFPALTELTSRETGVLASLGVGSVVCCGRPRVALFSTGDELVAPGEELRPGTIFDANTRIIADALRENGAEPIFLGIIPDDEEAIGRTLREAKQYDAVVLSGGTSKGAGDLSFRLIDEVGEPGILVHGVQVKPGKPIVLAAWDRRPVVVLPGFPTSAILTFNLFVRPVIRRLAGRPTEEPQAVVEAVVPQRLHSAPGRYEYKLVHLVHDAEGGFVAHPIPKGSGSISAFAEADGYVEIPEGRDMLLAGETARVTLLSRSVRPADLVFIGSHCQGMDLLFRMLREHHGLTVKVLNVGSVGGVVAATRGEADVAGIHLLGEDGRYNLAAWESTEGKARLIRGYRRRQGLLFRKSDFDSPPTMLELAVESPRRLMNRSRGSGTRVLFDRLLSEIARERGGGLEDLVEAIPGYDVEARSHNAAAVAVATGKADWAVGIESAARHYDLGFVSLRDEDYDLLVPVSREQASTVGNLLKLMQTREFRDGIRDLGGFEIGDDAGRILA